MTATVAQRFCLTDGGRSESKRPRQDNDCAVRAYALATGEDYDVVYDRFLKMGRKSHQGVPMSAWEALMRVERWELISFPAVKGERRMNPATFVNQFEDGIYIIRTAKHLAAVIDGIICDTVMPEPDRCIYRAWKAPASCS